MYIHKYVATYVCMYVDDIPYNLCNYVTMR